MTAVHPITTSPQPETAVKVPARSIVSRMKRRLSIARSCISGGVVWGGRRGITGGMARMVEGGCGGSKYFVIQSNGQETVPGRSYEFASLPSLSAAQRTIRVFWSEATKDLLLTPIAGKSFAA